MRLSLMIFVSFAVFLVSLPMSLIVAVTSEEACMLLVAGTVVFLC